jgi:ubiquinone biosynthesis protein
MDITPRTLGGLALGRRIRHMGRLAQITNVFARHGLWSIAERLGIKSQLTPEQVREAESMSRASDDRPPESGAPRELGADSAPPLPPGVQEIKGLPARLRRSFEELGPAFVKLGQVLATREDVMPKEYIDELAKLHHSVAALPFATIREILARELGETKLAALDINERPLAAGSIAQVHEARLRGGPRAGERLVIKVQRPGIGEQIKVDLSLMEELAALVERFIPETQFARPTAMIQEFSRALEGELDFVREAGNITKIRRNLAAQAHVRIPEVLWEYSTARVLSQTYLDGLPAWDRDRIVGAGLSPELLVERGLGMFLRMVFVDGLFHGDLHPGNLLALPNDEVGVIDFGLCVHLGKATRENLAGLLIALVEEDFNRAVMHYLELAEPATTFDAHAFEHEVGNVVAPFIGLSLADLHAGRLFWDLARVAARHGAPMPGELVIFIKTLVSFEGIGVRLLPGFDVLKASEKFTAEIAAKLYSKDALKEQALHIARDVAQLAKHGPFQLRRLLKAALAGELTLNARSPDLERLAVSLDRSSSRLSISMIIGALIIGSSILAYAHEAGGRVMPPVGLIGFALAGLLGAYVMWSVWRGK